LHAQQVLLRYSTIIGLPQNQGIQGISRNVMFNLGKSVQIDKFFTKSGKIIEILSFTLCYFRAITFPILNYTSKLNVTVAKFFPFVYHFVLYSPYETKLYFLCRQQLEWQKYRVKAL